MPAWWCIAPSRSGCRCLAAASPALSRAPEHQIRRCRRRGRHVSGVRAVAHCGSATTGRDSHGRLACVLAPDDRSPATSFCREVRHVDRRALSRKLGPDRTGGCQWENIDRLVRLGRNTPRQAGHHCGRGQRNPCPHPTTRSLNQSHVEEIARIAGFGTSKYYGTYDATRLPARSRETRLWCRPDRAPRW